MGGREFDIIRRYFSDLAQGTQVVLGPGDDCALIDVPADHTLCMTTDTLLEGVHFPLGATGNIVAHRSVAANLSDIAAMGARPLAMTIALTLPADDEGWLEAFASTLSHLVSQYNVPLVGGNLAQGSLSVTLTVLGVLPVSKGLRRDGAMVGDDLYVSGTLGDAGAGLALVLAGDTEPGFLKDRYHHSTPRLDLGRALLDIATSAIDVSDGLVADAGHIAERSGVGLVINAARVPMSAPLLAAHDSQSALALALSAGDDYELCFTAPATTRVTIDALAKTLALPLTRIGVVVAGAAVTVVDAEGEPVPVPDAGYVHFTR